MKPTDDREHIEFLLSRSLDEPLTDDEQRQLDQALADDPSLADELAAYQRADDAIQQWAGEVPEVDWDAFGESIRTQQADSASDHRPLRIIRILAPLAVAAAVAFAFMISEKPTESPSDIVVEYVQSDDSVDDEIEISFDQTESLETEYIRPSIAMAAVGTHVRLPSLDDEHRGG